MPTPEPLLTPADRVNPLLTAADIMTASPRTCSPFSTVLEAVLIFRDADCGVVPVLDGGKAVGVLTDRDVALALIDRGSALAGLPVAEVMTGGAVTVREDAGLDDILRTFEEAGVRRLPVVSADGAVRGVISWSDLARHASDRGVGGLVERPGPGRAAEGH